MTSVPFNVGLQDNTRSSSRVLRPPGGGHTDIFGGEAEPTRGRRPAPSVLAAAAAAHEAAEAKANEAKSNGTSEAPQNGQFIEPQEAPSHPEPKIESSVKPESPVKLDSPVTPDSPKREIAQPEPAKVEPPRRVRVPPGGFSSGLW